MPHQLAIDFTPPPVVGLVHLGPIQNDDGTGCDCCAQRLRCGVCGARYLGRLWAYYYRFDTRDDEGYSIGRNGSYGDLPGPCCLPEDPRRFDSLLNPDEPDMSDEMCEEPVRKGQFVFGSWGVLRARIWVPAIWPTGLSPHDREYQESQSRHNRRGKR